MNAFVVNLIRFLWSATQQNKIWIIRFLRQCTYMQLYYVRLSFASKSHKALSCTMNERKAA